MEGAPRLVLRDGVGALWLEDLETSATELLSSSTPAGFDQTGAGFRGTRDAEGNYWLPSNGGLFRARKETIASVGSWETYPILEGRDGTVWIGTAAHGLYSLRNGVLTCEVRPEDAPALRNHPSTSLYEDRAGQLWVNGRWRLAGHELVLDRTLAGLTTMETYATCEDRDGAFWRGGVTGVWRTRNGIHTSFTTKDGLAGDDTKVIIEDGHGGIWIGGTGGLTHESGGRFTA
jgi:ligand-binding sensor domain-containing protein